MTIKENSIFTCPKCGHSVERTGLYHRVLECQNAINMMMGNNKIIDLCGNCNHFEYEE